MSGKKGDWKSAVEHVKGLHKAPGRQDDLVAAQAREAIHFLEERQLITVPPIAAETWRLKMITAKGQKTLPFAVYQGQSMGVAYATDGMEHDTKRMSMRGNNVSQMERSNQKSFCVIGLRTGCPTTTSMQ